MKELNDVKKVIILAAGRSRRMEQLSSRDPKCLLPYKGERILERLVRQIKENGIEKIYITTGYRANKIANIFSGDSAVETIENKFYEEDVNVLSMSLALSKISDEAVVIFEADTIMEDDLVKYVLGTDFVDKSIWFTRGRFNETQYGGIVKSNKYGEISDIRIVSAYNDKFKLYSKLTGIMRVSSNEIELFRALVHKYAKTTVKQYFLQAWIENLKLLPCYEASIENFRFFTFNTPPEYYQIQNVNLDDNQEMTKVNVVEMKRLHHIEEYDEERISTLQMKIENDGVWRVPIIVTDNTGLILDGQHRYEVACNMGLKRIPAIEVDYNEVKVWSLRKEIKISQNIVKNKVLKEGKIFPYKTVKHKFGFNIPKVEYKIEDLR